MSMEKWEQILERVANKNRVRLFDREKEDTATKDELIHDFINGLSITKSISLAILGAKTIRSTIWIYDNGKGCFPFSYSNDTTMKLAAIVESQYDTVKVHFITNEAIDQYAREITMESFDNEVQPISIEDTTCFSCQQKDTCAYAGDAYNTNGDCLKDK